MFCHYCMDDKLIDKFNSHFFLRIQINCNEKYRSIFIPNNWI